MKTIILTNTLFLLWLLPGMTWGQFLTISGYVNDSSNGKALENVSIFEKNSGIGTISNQNGFYRLVLIKKDVDLSITNEGFKTFTSKMRLNADTTLVVKLEPRLNKKAQELQEELHAGIERTKKRNVRRSSDFK